MTPLLCRKVAKGDTHLDALTATDCLEVREERTSFWVLREDGVEVRGIGRV